MHHLGTKDRPEWQEYVGHPPEANELILHFQSHPNDRENTLWFRQKDVKLDWLISLNGKRLGQLATIEEPQIQALAVPPDLLHEGDNVLSIRGPRQPDDIEVGGFQIMAAALHDVLSQARLEIEVRDADSHEFIPARITIVDTHGALVPLAVNGDGTHLAARPGAVYTANGQAALDLPSGEYQIYATRGFEYGVDHRAVSLSQGESESIRLRIRREVDTAGWAGSDTHIHTVTFSGHGDCTLAERMVTLAGEGIELPVATDHNRAVDYEAAARQAGAAKYFTPVTGDEVTTARGHFNVFPLSSGGPLPDARLTNWPALAASIQSVPGVEVVILNHPCDEHAGFRPFERPHFDPVTGESWLDQAPICTAVELANSSAQLSDFMRVFRDWFALLNHGQRIFGVGSSDCHDVNRYLVGQGRTYVACDDRDPSQLSVAQACRSFQEGRLLVSMGLLVEMKVNDQWSVGDLAKPGSEMRVSLTVRSPSWSHADRVRLFCNGELLREQTFPQATSSSRSGGSVRQVAWTFPAPAHDVYLVALATGPAQSSPFWPIPKPYQPTSIQWQAHMIGATNPIWVDGDGDGQYTSPFGYARNLWEQAGRDASKLVELLRNVDPAVVIQSAALARQSGVDLNQPVFLKALAGAPETVRQGFKALNNN